MFWLMRKVLSGYEIDLNAANAQALRDALTPYVTAGRRASGAARRAARGRAPGTGERGEHERGP